MIINSKIPITQNKLMDTGKIPDNNARIQINNTSQVNIITTQADREVERMEITSTHCRQ